MTTTTCRFDAIFFDSGGTLFRAHIDPATCPDPTPSQVRAGRASRVTAALVSLGHDVGEPRVSAALLAAEAELEGRLSARLSYFHLMQSFARHVNLPIQDSEAALLSVPYNGPRYASWLFPDLHPLFERLREAGPVIGLIANTALTGWCMDTCLAGVGLLPYFRTRVCSGDVGLSKPDPAIFHLALERAGLTTSPSDVRSGLSLVSPNRILYIGDSPDKDMAPAKSLGWATAWRRPPNAATATCPDADYTFEHSLDLLPFVFSADP